MSVHQSAERLPVLGVGFWLLLPVVGLGFWLAGLLLTQQVLQGTETSIQQLQATLPINVHDPEIRLIQARVDRIEGKTQVKVQPVDLVVGGQQLELSTTRLDEVETLIAQELSIPPAMVQRLTQYTIWEPVQAQLEVSD